MSSRRATPPRPWPQHRLPARRIPRPVCRRGGRRRPCPCSRPPRRGRRRLPLPLILLRPPRPEAIRTRPGSPPSILRPSRPSRLRHRPVTTRAPPSRSRPLPRRPLPRRPPRPGRLVAPCSAGSSVAVPATGADASRSRSCWRPGSARGARERSLGRVAGRGPSASLTV